MIRTNPKPFTFETGVVMEIKMYFYLAALSWHGHDILYVQTQPFCTIIGSKTSDARF